MRAFIAAVVSLLAAGCAGMDSSGGGAAAGADLKNPGGETVGSATLTQTGDTVRVVVAVRGLPPGVHAVHVHTTGKCESPGFMSSGGHFNPGGRQHGSQNPQGAHAGDLPNMTVAADGTGRLETTTTQFTLGAGATTLFDADGSALVVHAAPDDFKTDPTGNAGARIACGVIVKK
jgi:Cu-Zn family superoxide dismutase